MLKKVLLVLAVVVVGFLIMVSMRPSESHIERKTTIAAPASVVFPFVNDFKEWMRWNPWDAMEPTSKKTYSPSTSGVGAFYTWEGEKMGQGKMTITESKPNERVAYKLDFIKPFAATNAVVMTLKEKGPSTEIVWSMDGHNDFMMKAFGVFMDMDKAVGGDFERGLAQLKTLAEAKAKEAPASMPASAPAAQ